MCWIGAGADAGGAPSMLGGEAATGITCPTCGGAIWDDDGEDALGFHCRIGHSFSLGAMLADHAVKHRQTLGSATRYTAEAAALRRFVASWARAHGHGLAATRLEQEADMLDRAAHEIERVAGTALMPLASPGPR